MAKFKERIQARELRRKGESIREIAKKLGVSKGSVSLWCTDIFLTDEQKAMLIERDRVGGAKGRLMANEGKKKERRERLKRYMKVGGQMVGSLSERDLLIAGIALYWAEGNKKNRRLLFSNSDPVMIKIIIKWLTQCLHIPKEDIYCRVGINQLHKYRVKDVERYWSEVTGTPLADFRIVSLKKVSASKVYENPEKHFGTLNIMVKKCTNLNYLVLGMIDRLGSLEARS